MISSESVVSSDIAKSLKDEFSFVQLESIKKRIHITFDHMSSHDNYITLMFTMRIGKQGIPIWFKSFKQEYINKENSLEK